jgi:hypothetical protein
MVSEENYVASRIVFPCQSNVSPSLNSRLSVSFVFRSLLMVYRGFMVSLETLSNGFLTHHVLRFIQNIESVSVCVLTNWEI